MASALGSAATAAVGFVVAVVQHTYESGAPAATPLIFLYLFVGGGIAAFVVASTIGLAWHTLAKRRGWTSSVTYWLLALVIGFLLPTCLLVLPTWGAMFDAESNLGASLAPIVCPFGAALGGFTGYFFWLIRRPDRDPPNPATAAP